MNNNVYQFLVSFVMGGVSRTHVVNTINSESAVFITQGIFNEDIEIVLVEVVQNHTLQNPIVCV